MEKAKKEGGLGFRDLECFNTALLAKQGWQIIQNPDSLVAKVLKEKYFPNGSFLDIPLSKRPSYVWRSIWNAKFLLKEGLVWRVGDGRNIKIWGDKWLPSPNTYTIQTPARILDLEAKMCDLIDPDPSWWNIPLIKEIFREEEVEMIYGMTICPKTQQDRAVWAGNKSHSPQCIPYGEGAGKHRSQELFKGRYVDNFTEQDLTDESSKGGLFIPLASLQ